MKLYIFLSITVAVLICSKLVEAENRHKKHVDHGNSDILNSNSIYRNNEQVSLQELHEHGIFNHLHKDKVVVKDANGNIQEYTKISMSNGSKFNIDNCLYFMFALVTYILSSFN